VQELRTALNGEDSNRIRALSEDLQKEFASAAQTTAQAGGPTGRRLQALVHSRVRFL
jgi:hypothetical protein